MAADEFAFLDPRFSKCINSTAGVYRHPAGYTNGNTVDRQGRLLSCEHGGRRVSRTEFNGTVITIVDSFEGKRLNSPNDVVVKSDDSIWFTDPAYGIESDYEGHRSQMELDGCHVFRVDPTSGDIRIVAGDFVRPNGIAFSPSRIPAPRMDRTAHAISAASPSMMTPPSPGAKSSPPAPRDSSMASGS